MPDLSQVRLKELLSYDSLSGVFRWKVNRPRARAGDLAGCLSSGGYMRIQVAGRSYPLHRLAFLYMEGAFPADEVDHINRDRLDNRFSNLRKVEKAANLRNKGIYRNSALGVTGVSQRGSRYRAYINRDGRRVGLGTFDTLAEAKQAYASAKEILHPEYFTCHH